MFGGLEDGVVNVCGFDKDTIATLLFEAFQRIKDSVEQDPTSLPPHLRIYHTPQARQGVQVSEIA